MAFAKFEVGRSEIHGSPAQTTSFLIGIFFLFGGLLNRHVMKLFRIKDIAALKTLDIFRVLMAGDNSNPGVFAGGSHHCGTSSD